ncbi:hypothetical protein DFP93_102413 [Aneurinibacillus soli]|uniref:Uncharacterized protein n=1 Tax=Aneurinibacillus soli TaxID=1500254 RepID=A0A0U5B206_9BACL|nr:hypothetical protein [Aneurinibacillus soli]PYE63724.1 hypothetical protein DFP93_102413 [Aneurinibacillus soli]BAU27343.1 hypothetical protein CB4_01517 [Aneurinibacillus soli]
MKKGIVPVALGTAVTAAGLSMLNRRQKDIRSDNPYAWGVTGFGLAHVVLGAIDLMSDNYDDDDFC